MVDTCFNLQDIHKVFLKTSLFNQSMKSIHNCIPAGDTMRAQGPPTRGPPCHPPSREKFTTTMEKPKVPEPKDPTHQDQGLDLSAATWQPQAAPPAYQTWASPQQMAARLLVSGDVEQNPGPPTNYKQKATNKSSATTSTFICSICNKQITNRHCSFRCNHPTSNHWVHQKCTTSLINDYNDNWTCPSHPQNINTPITAKTATTTQPINIPATCQPKSKTHSSHSKTPPHNMNPSHNRTLKILQLNINGINNKIAELQQFLNEENIDIAAIQETRLHPSNKTPEIKGYSCTRKDRPLPASSNTKINGGGLITYVKEDICYSNTETYKLKDIETQTVTVPLIQTKNLIISNLYLPQKTLIKKLKTQTSPPYSHDSPTSQIH